MADYSIWVCEYAYVKKYHKSGVIYGAHNQGYVKLPYCYVVIKGRDHVAMVDVGFNQKDYGATLATRFGVENWHSPAQVMAPLGIKPDDVDSCFITHAHFDHFGNVEAFPKATFYVQQREISKWVWVMSLPERMRWMMGAVDSGDIVRGVALAQQNRLVTVDGDMDDVLPGIDLRAAFDTHTYGSMWVAVRNDGNAESNDKWVLAGDLVYMFENLNGVDDGSGASGVYTPVGLAVGSQTNLVLATEAMMKAVNYESHRVIPIHEERLKDTFPSRITSDGLRITEICLADGDESRVG
ncbi:N-acyl homoserine lactonase family protein [Castellaniella caeni]|uniref:N-acyl homoserine lactonase family protein n=1 Tax=Castellaniella caeni TaxID=266123 RepID=UPI00083602C9|nr:N-acyl homoserine lactonase family protein [Castellaniella caeni]